MNLRTITADTRARLEHSVEVRHGRALQKSQQEVQALKTQLEEEEYILRLEKEGVTLRAKNQRMKDKESLKEAEERQDRLQELVAAAEMCSVNLGRKLQVQTCSIPGEGVYVFSPVTYMCTACKLIVIRYILIT